MRRTFGRPRAALALVAVVALAAAGCGGGGGGGDRLSEAEFRDQAEAICRDLEQTTVQQPSGPDDVQRYVDEFSALLDRSAEDFHALKPPEDLQAQWDEYLRLVDEGVAAVHRFGDDVVTVSGAELQRVAQEYQAHVSRLATSGHAIERSLGLDECVT